MPVPKPYVLFQLMVNDRTAWQVVRSVDPKLCRKMSADELTAIGDAVSNALAAVVGGAKVYAEPNAKQAVADQSKKKR